MNTKLSDFKGAAQGDVDTYRKGTALPHIKRQSRGNRRVLSAIFLLLTTHCSLLPVSAASWSRQRTSSLAWLHSVFFLDKNRGWAVGSRGTLLATTDGGNHWISLVHPTEDTIRDVYFADDQNGIIVCERNIYDLKSNAEARAYLMKTIDGGEHWKRSNLRGVDADARIMRAIFTGAGRGCLWRSRRGVYNARHGYDLDQITGAHALLAVGRRFY